MSSMSPRALHRMRLGRVTSIVVLAALVMAGCASHPAGLQSGCDRTSEAKEALDHGDESEAKAKLNSAMNWIDAAIEDTEGAERRIAERWADAVDRAEYLVGSREGLRALDEALAACES